MFSKTDSMVQEGTTWCEQGHVTDYYEPVSNDLVTLLLDEADKLFLDEKHRLSTAPSRIGQFVKGRLTPRSLKEKMGHQQKLSPEQQLMYDALVFLLHYRGEDTRRISHFLEGKHEIDTALILNHYDYSAKIDHLDITIALLHDLLEDFPVLSAAEIMNYFSATTLKRVSESSSSSLERDLSDIVEAIKVLKREGYAGQSRDDHLSPESYFEHIHKAFYENKRTGKVKLADKIAQSYEVIERGFFPWLRGQKEAVRNHPFFSHARKYLLSSGQGANSHGEYQLPRVVHDFMFNMRDKSGAFILNTIFKDIIVIDTACAYLNQLPFDDSELARLKNVLVFRTVAAIIEPNLRFYEDKGYVQPGHAQAIITEVDALQNSGDLYRITEDGRHAIIIPTYLPAIHGDKSRLKQKNAEWNEQYHHLAIWERLLKTGYGRDITATCGKPKQKGLFTFDWEVHT